MKLRKRSGGLLKMGEDELLPKLKMEGMDDDEFTSGDARATENPGLASLHTIFLREHNRIASHLNSMQPQHSDEELYQMTRRIVIAEMQNIVYGQYLPDTLLGPETVARFDLGIDEASNYQPDTNPSIINAFA